MCFCLLSSFTIVNPDAKHLFVGSNLGSAVWLEQFGSWFGFPVRLSRGPKLMSDLWIPKSECFVASQEGDYFM